MRDRRVEEISPPIITIARGEIKGLVEMAMGIKPPMAVKVVKIIGKNLTSPASFIACSIGMPSARNWLVKSTNKIVFFTSIPASAIRPTVATKESGVPVNQRAKSAPTMPKGITESTINVLLNVPNSRISTAIKKKMVTRMIVPKPLKLSFALSTSPPISKWYPAGSAIFSRFFSVSAITSLLRKPFSTNELTDTKRFLFK